MVFVNLKIASVDIHIFVKGLYPYRPRNRRKAENEKKVHVYSYVKLHVKPILPSPFVLKYNQRTNGPINAYLISGPNISTKNVSPKLTVVR